MVNNLAVKKEYILSETQKTVQPNDLNQVNNAALARLGSAIQNRNNIIDFTNYSRMHNRHNRS